MPCWIIDTKRFEEELDDRYGEYTKNDIEKVGNYINMQMEKIVCNICEHPECIMRKAEKAIERIRTYHSLINYEMALKSIYVGNDEIK